MGIILCIPSTIPKPALSIGTITTGFSSSYAVIFAMGVSMSTGLVLKSLVISYVISAPISDTVSLNAFVLV